MKNASSLVKHALVTAAVIATTGFSVHAVAEDKPAVGTISGTVTTSAGATASNVLIYFMGTTETSIRTGGSAAGNKGDHKRATGLQPAPLELGKAMIKGKATTDANGKFEIKTLTAGAYTYRAGLPAAGMKTGDVTVEAGKTATLDIKLDAPQK